jgi:hypothetical protein
MAGYSFHEQACMIFTYVALMIMIAMPQGSTKKLSPLTQNHNFFGHATQQHQYAADL